MRSKVVRYDSMSVRLSFLDLRSSFLDKMSTIRSKSSICFAMAPNRFSFSSAEWVRSASRLHIISRITPTTLARSPVEGCGSERAASPSVGAMSCGGEYVRGTSWLGEKYALSWVCDEGFCRSTVGRSPAPLPGSAVPSG